MTNNIYDYQKEANIFCLVDDREYLERKNVLWKVITTFQEDHIRWGLGCSANLFLRGIVDEFHDFDLIVEEDDIPKLQVVMSRIGGKIIETGGNGFCESNVYFHYQFDRVDVDVIAGFRIKTFGTEYFYEYNSREIEQCTIYEENKITIPLIPVEALYVLYYMMEGWQARRRYKRVLIQNFLEDKVIFPNILEKALEENLPSFIKRNIRKLIEA